MDFSIISQDPTIRAMVQDQALQRAFHDALFPAMLFRAEASPIFWPANVGDTQVFTGRGLLSPDMAPLKPGTDPEPDSWTAEQWTAVAQEWAKAVDTFMPNSIVAIANLFYANAQQLGLAGAMTLNRLVRNKLFNAALSGNTVSDTGCSGANTLHVKSCSGLTTARRPDVSTGSAVQFSAVSATNPLPVRIMQSNGTEVTRNITACALDAIADTVNGGTRYDERGGGTITFDGSPITVSARGYVVASDASYVVRVGGGNQVDVIGPNDTLKLADIRAAVARLRLMNIPTHADGRYHCHLDPISESEIFGDAEFQRLSTATLGENYMYRDFAIGDKLGCIFFRNNECPLPTSVLGGTITTPIFNLHDPFGGELYSSGTNTGTPVHRAIFTGGDACKEYYLDTSGLITEAGLNGKIGEFSGRLHNNGIEIMADRIELILRAPLDRLQQKVSAAYRFAGDFVIRTDSATGDAARIKRMVCIEHA